MRKASRIVLIVATILSWVSFGSLLLASVVMFVCASPFVINGILQGIESGDITVHGDIPPEAIPAMLTGLFVGLGVGFIILSVFCLLCAVFSNKAKEKEETGPYVTAIVFGALTGMYASIVGSIFGLIAEKQRKNAEVIDMTK